MRLRGEYGLVRLRVGDWRIIMRDSAVLRILVEIEAGRSTGSVHTLRKLADALGVAVDDIIRRADDGTR